MAHQTGGIDLKILLGFGSKVNRQFLFTTKMFLEKYINKN